MSTAMSFTLVTRVQCLALLLQKAGAWAAGSGFLNTPKPGQSHLQALMTAWLGQAQTGLAGLGSWPKAGPGTTL